MEDLILAIKNNDYIKVKLALKNNPDLNISLKNEDSENIFFLAIKYKADPDILKLLIDAGLDLTYTTKEGVGIFDEAISVNSLELIKYLVEEKGINPLVTNRKSGFTPLMQAASYGYLEIVKYLIKKGANIHQIDTFGFNAKDYARKLGQTRVLKYLNSL